jgi:hypothetical protein
MVDDRNIPGRWGLSLATATCNKFMMSTQGRLRLESHYEREKYAETYLLARLPLNRGIHESRLKICPY